MRVLGFNTLAFVGLSLTPASDSALIIPTTIPLATALFATLIQEPLTSRKLFGFAVASVGAALVIVGVGAIVLRKESVLGHVTFTLLIGTAMLLPLGALPQGYRDVPTWRTETWLAAGFLGVFSTSVAFVLFFWAVHRYGASLAAMVTYLTPIATLVLAFLILGERQLPLQLAGAP